MKYLAFIFITIACFSCATKEVIKDYSYYYNEGLRLTQKKLYQEAADNFAEVGRGKLYIKAKVMEAYSYYKTKRYDECIAKIEIIKNLKGEIAKENRLYLNYIEGMVYYRQLAGYKSSQDSAILAFTSFQKINDKQAGINKWQEDTKERLKIIKDTISKNYIYLAKYYMETENFIPAINALKTASDNIYSEDSRAEALYRLAEIYYHLGITKKSKQLLDVINIEYSEDNKWRKYGKKLFSKFSQ
jgi:outer membrane protein assembly factor BamD